MSNDVVYDWARDEKAFERPLPAYDRAAVIKNLFEGETSGD